MVLGMKMIVKPRGNERVFNTTAITTTSSYQTVCELEIEQDESFDLAMFACGCDKDIWFRLLFKGKVITPEIIGMGLTYIQIWVPSGYKKVIEAGKFTLQVKYVSAAGSAFGEIVGDKC